MPIKKIDLADKNDFSLILFDRLKEINPAVNNLELYEFRYALNNLTPAQGWGSIILDTTVEIEQRVNNRTFYDSIQIKPCINDQIVLDKPIVDLTTMLFVGLVTEDFSVEWVKQHFYFDLRGFYFLHRTHYLTAEVLAHFNNKPYRQFEQKQKAFEHNQELGYRDFRDANREVDNLLIAATHKIIKRRGTPILLAIAGPTAAGKTEIVERLRESFEEKGNRIAAIEMDNYLTDRDYREKMGIFTQGKAALHFELLQKNLEQICRGEKISIPRYDFVYATSSHDLSGNLKPGGIPIEIEPADIIFMEGNFPFLLPEIAPLVGIKVVYLTDDPIRMKRKWRRDIDYRKKYEPTYFRNRFFKEQFIMAEFAYIPQMQVCDILVDTTGAALWTTLEMQQFLEIDNE